MEFHDYLVSFVVFCSNHLSVLKEKMTYFTHGIKGKRETMEDHVCSFVFKIQKTEVRLYGLFDGHGGADASEFVSKNIGKVFCKEMQTRQILNKIHCIVALRNTFTTLQNMMMKQYKKYATQGTTALLLAQVRHEPGKWRFYCANAGDSKAMIYLDESKKFFDLSIEHKPSLPVEYKRVTKLGGFVRLEKDSTPRVFGNGNMETVGLSTSRSIGDLESMYAGKDLKPLAEGQFLISPKPDVAVIDIVDGKRGFIVLGCDGVWDVLKNNQVVDAVLKTKKSNPSREVVSLAYSQGSTDNITCSVIKF
jgi:serine/threonine protein phosphatase PrpC